MDTDKGPQTLGQIIRSARKGLSMPKVRLAELSGVNVAYIARLEDDSHDPGFSNVVRIARILSIPMEKIAATVDCCVVPAPTDFEHEVRILHIEEYLRSAGPLGRHKEPFVPPTACPLPRGSTR